MTTSGEGSKPTSFLDATTVHADAATGGPARTSSWEGEILKAAYRVDAKLGEGGMGTIYRGTQLSLGRAVAIKTLSRSNKLTDEAVQRFFREAKILSQLNHPNIVNIIDFGTAEPVLRRSSSWSCFLASRSTPT